MQTTIKTIGLLAIIMCICGNTYAQQKIATTANMEQLSAKLPLNNSKIIITAADVMQTSVTLLPFDNNPVVTITNIVTKELTNVEINKGVKLPTSVTLEYNKAYEKKQPKIYAFLPKYIQQANGAIAEVVSYTIDVKNGSPIKKTRGTRVYANNSVLANGDWYKFTIPSRNVYKLTYSFFKTDLNINIDNIDANTIKVFGNGGGLIPEDNNITRPDDLVENAIMAVGLTDGKFDANDYLLMYAPGPHTIVPDVANSIYKTVNNFYTDVSTYYITYGGAAGKRIATNAPITGTPNVVVNTFVDYAYWEKDSINLGFAFDAGCYGNRWWGNTFGNRFGMVTARNFTNIFKNIVKTEPIKINALVAHRSNNAGGNFALKYNGTTLANASTFTVGNSYGDPLALVSFMQGSVLPTADEVTATLNYNSADDYSLGLLDYLNINATRALKVEEKAMVFANFKNIANGNILDYSIANTTANTKIWDITNPLIPANISLLSTGNFIDKGDTFKQYILVEGTDFNTPKALGKISNQNLHAITETDYIIVTHPTFLAQAQALALHHQYKRDFKTTVVTTEQVYNEFGSGSPDISAIRDFTKMLYDKAASLERLPRNILLMGDASFDFKNKLGLGGNYVPSRETYESELKIAMYCSDDFFGILDDNENIQNESIVNPMDIGVGRFVCNNTKEASDLVTKVKIYDSAASFGSWKLNATYCADNKDNAAHAQDGEIMSSIARDSMPALNRYKLYVDAFPIYPTPGGERAPQAKASLDGQLYNGTLIVNYNGHGGPDAWCDERIFHISDIPTYTNLTKLPVFVTATCDFAPFSNPNKVSAGEKLMLYAKGGSIANLTTTQLVYQYENRIINRDFYRSLFSKQANGKYLSLGEAITKAKNVTYKSQNGNLDNFRKFALLGDPALELPIPINNVTLDSINNVSVNENIDTLKALGMYTLSGTVTNSSGAVLSNFNGTVDVTIFDKEKQLSTLSQHPESPKVDYALQNEIIFKGKKTVTNGRWSIVFRMPKDINYNFGKCKVVMYAYNNVQDAYGYSTKPTLGGLSNVTITDNVGPVIKPFLNNKSFINGGITGSNNNLLVDLKDENGINYSGTSIGHDITMVLDNNAAEPIVLNNFYEGAKDDFTSGTVNYPIKNLAIGPHTATIKAWDILNNSNTAIIDFVVVDNQSTAIDKVFNYPNPFTTNTNFTFEHNHPGELLHITVEIYTVSGAIIKTISTMLQTDGNRVSNIAWDGLDQMGDKIGRGVYLYKIRYTTSAGKSAHKYEKLIKL